MIRPATLKNVHLAIGNIFRAAAIWSYGASMRITEERMRTSKADWMMVPLDISIHQFGSLPCSEDGCTRAASWWYGRYTETGVTQGEYSQVHGWFFCLSHVHAFHDRMMEGI